MATAAAPEQKVKQRGGTWVPVPEGHPKRWRILAVLVVSLLVVVLDNTVLNIALPTIQQDLHTSASELVWAVDSYVLVFAAFLFTWGVLGDRYGRKRILMIGLVLFATASAICAFSANAAMLITFRSIMGIGGAAVLPVTLAIITVVFPRHERGRAIGLWAAAVGGAVALGPVLGGLLLQNPSWTHWLTGNDWGSVFLINVPIVAVGLVGIIRIVPETKNPTAQRLDLVGLVISVVGLVTLVYGIIHTSETLVWITPSVLIPIGLGILILIGFVFYEAHSDHKSFDVDLFRNRGYAVSLSAVSLAFFALSGITFTLPFYLQVIRGYTTLQAGLCFIPFALGQLIAAPRSARLVARFGYKMVMTTGLVIVGVSLLFVARLEIDTPIVGILVAFFLFGLGMGSVIAPASTVMQNVLPLARVGAGSAVQNTVRQVFGAFGVAVIGTILATEYAQRAKPSLAQLPNGAGDGAASSIVATRQALEHAVTQGVPVQQVEAVRQGAYNAFLSSAHITSLVSVGVVFLAALAVGLLLPKITPPTAKAEGSPEETAAEAAGEPEATQQLDVTRQLDVTEHSEPAGESDSAGEPATPPTHVVGERA